MGSRKGYYPNTLTRLPVVDLRYLQGHDGSRHHGWQVKPQKSSPFTRTCACRNTLARGCFPYTIDVHDCALDNILTFRRSLRFSNHLHGTKTELHLAVLTSNYNHMNLPRNRHSALTS